MKFKNNKMASANIKALANVILILIIHQFKKNKDKKKERKHIFKKLKHTHLSVPLNVLSRQNKPVKD